MVYQATVQVVPYNIHKEDDMQNYTIDELLDEIDRRLGWENEQ